MIDWGSVGDWAFQTGRETTKEIAHWWYGPGKLKFDTTMFGDDPIETDPEHNGPPEQITPPPTG